MDLKENENGSPKVIEEEVIAGEVLANVDESPVDPLAEEKTIVRSRPQTSISVSESEIDRDESSSSKYTLQYVFLPFVFLTVAFLGGLRIGAKEGEFMFFGPPLICLIFATLLLTLFSRAHLIEFGNWFSDKHPALKNAANGAVLLSLFAASTQVFNSLIPEQGVPFWVIGFCFLWTLWNNLFAEFDSARLLKSLGGLFGFAFVAKYLVLANLVSGGEGSWLARVWQDPGKELFAYFLDLPRFAPATGYIQFFTLMFFLVGLYFMRPNIDSR